MRLKNALAMVAGLGAALVMSVATYAASEVKVENVVIDEYGATLPVVLNTTDEGKSDKVASWDITIKYDSSVWSYDGYNDPNTYTKRGVTSPLGTVFDSPAASQDGSIHMTYSCTGANGYPTIVDGKLTLIEIYLIPLGDTPAEVKDTDFNIYVNLVDDENAHDSDTYNGSIMKSFFKLDVTGDLGGNAVVGLAASVDGGVTKQPLNYYSSTTYTDGMEYADATTTFVVSVNNTKDAAGSASIADVTIYGVLEDGTYVPLTSYDQTNFLIQKFK